MEQTERENPSAPESAVLTIDRLHPKGPGVGRHGKWRVLVPYTIAGEKVEVQLLHRRRREAQAKLLKVVESSWERVEAACPHFGTCGGCAWQHMNYEAQLVAKEEYVRACFQEQGLDVSVVRPVIGMEEPWQYRNKMEFAFSPEGKLGLHAPGDYRRIIPLESCHIASSDMLAVAMEVRDWAREYRLPGYDKETHQGLLRHLMVRQSFATGEVMAVLYATRGPKAEGLQEAVRDLEHRLTSRIPQLVSLLWSINTAWADRAQGEETEVLHGREYIEERLAGFRYRVGKDTFFQTNPQQAEKLVELALEMGRPGAEEFVIDLFCGVGTFSLPFAQQCKKLAGIEIVEASIEAAKRNARENGIHNTCFLAADARRGMDHVLEQHGRPDLLVLDPPRSGAGGKVMRKIGRARPRRVVYISCNPATLAEDLKQLVEFGYRIQQVQPVDMFPHTPHVECVTLLVRDGA